ncbi:uncharacterized protein ARMOST_17019 [Armillaria ostoyae]|uniref:Uncharacterized protein n=1 Tax=Armillaria ostoyae TaxID=47428 RepID=A0A284RXU8_ARMOS|nr:uncharacterized protein ARMOST_17019 [Armillaria ostoyae]
MQTTNAVITVSRNSARGNDGLRLLLHRQGFPRDVDIHSLLLRLSGLSRNRSNPSTSASGCAPLWNGTERRATEITFYATPHFHYMSINISYAKSCCDQDTLNKSWVRMETANGKICTVNVLDRVRVTALFKGCLPVQVLRYDLVSADQDLPSIARIRVDNHLLIRKHHAAPIDTSGHHPPLLVCCSSLSVISLSILCLNPVGGDHRHTKGPSISTPVINDSINFPGREIMFILHHGSNYQLEDETAT